MKLTTEQKTQWLPRLWEITQQCHTTTELPTRAFFEQCVYDGHVWTAHGGGELDTKYEIVGYVLCNDVYYNGPLLRNIVVMPEWRGQGLGMFLLKEIEKYFKDKGGVEALTLHCKVDNPAQKLYFDAGYRVVSRLADYYAPEGDGLKMEKIL